MDNSLPGIFCAPSGFFFYSPMLETLVLSGFAFLGNRVHCQIFKATGLGLTWPQRHPDTMGQAFQGHEGTCTHVRFQLALVIIALVFSPLANQANAFFLSGLVFPHWCLVCGLHFLCLGTPIDHCKRQSTRASMSHTSLMGWCTLREACICRACSPATLTPLFLGTRLRGFPLPLGWLCVFPLDKGQVYQIFWTCALLMNGRLPVHCTYMAKWSLGTYPLIA